ncbi:Qat anti-phage system QueC-like protein QatC [Coraliomargarita sinensis]|uniref:Qat anti-phage system QueC-like protein QatC n=1 Tax=Coraliomargarita sinensis TaxID=2174842 RepID=UPI0011B74DE1|nr:Qat anti-phage system QueC-like protein QatC [Coraliomargarita sinensis]
MRTEITVKVDANPNRKKECAGMFLDINGGAKTAVMDVDGTSILKVSRSTPDLAQDFLTIASCIYAADKAVSRKLQDDRWSRDISIEIPIHNLVHWSSASKLLEECVEFLTGDKWDISFSQTPMRLIQRKPRRRRTRFTLPTGDAVCLFSGGLDSLIGAIDWLETNGDGRVMLSGHYDKDVGGPKKDQNSLKELLQSEYPNRFQLAQNRLGLSSGSSDTNFRSRSLVFLALGCYYAEILGANTPVLIPENGPIALNFPLTPARRGSCSTRTVHPYFIGKLNEVFAAVGITTPVSNPYELKTKGEMVAGCLNQPLLQSAYPVSRSCSKFGHTSSWDNRSAGSCGICVPCLFRRASLHVNGWDNQNYGRRFERFNNPLELPDDPLALIAFAKKPLSDREIAARLLGNGRLPFEKLPEYVDLVKRMRQEVLAWMHAVGTPQILRGVPRC